MRNPSRNFVRIVVTGLAAVGLTACSGDDAPETATVSPVGTASDEPSGGASPAQTPSPAPSRYLPVDSLGQSEIPWDDVGPGWFLVAWRGPSAPSLVDDFLVGPSPSGFSLVGPDARVYALSDLGVVDAAWVIDWRGEQVGVARNPDVAEGDFGDVATLNLQTGAEETVVLRDQIPVAHYVAANGDLVGSQFYGDLPVPVFEYRDYHVVGKICDGNGGRRLMSPDRIRVVCLDFLSPDDTRTAVVIGRADRASPAEQIDVFRASAYRYSVDGWFDSDTLLLERRAETYGDPSTFFAYNISTRTISDYAIPIAGLLDSPYISLQFDYSSQTFLVSRSDGVGFYYPSGVEFYGSDGTLVASVACEHPDDSLSLAEVTYSGDFALVSCGGSLPEEVVASLTLVSLRDGTTTSIAVFTESFDAHLGGVTPFSGDT